MPAGRPRKEIDRKEFVKKIGIPEKRFAVILKTVDFDELDFKDGKFSKADDLEKDAKEEWADFIVTAKETGVDSRPPMRLTDEPMPDCRFRKEVNESNATT